MLLGVLIASDNIASLYTNKINYELLVVSNKEYVAVSGSNIANLEARMVIFDFFFLGDPLNECYYSNEMGFFRAETNFLNRKVIIQEKKIKKLRSALIGTTAVGVGVGVLVKMLFRLLAK